MTLRLMARAGNTEAIMCTNTGLIVSAASLFIWLPEAQLHPNALCEQHAFSVDPNFALAQYENER